MVVVIGMPIASQERPWLTFAAEQQCLSIERSTVPQMLSLQQQNGSVNKT
jgi:hypothetical protein